MRQYLLSLIFIPLLLVTGSGQWKTMDVFKSDTGFFLITKLAQNYKPTQVLDYSQARVKMYTEIYNIKDTVYCVYSKHALYLSPSSVDPIGDLIKNGNSNGINCEHTFPQSKGADIGNARSDMHHLYPSRAAVNEARSNYPYAEINDSNTDHWYYKTQNLTTKPSSLVNEYSEGISNQFEPREDHKGNVARAIFYFFTMYEFQSDASFFNSMKTTLCDWHNYDPVDSLEWERTFAIAKYQDNKANPFVLDCSLAKRAYCPNLQICKINSNTIDLFDQINPYYDYYSKEIRLNTISTDKKISYNIYNALGQIVSQKNNIANSNIIQLNSYSNGIYFFQLLIDGQQLVFKFQII
jgi:hypothetical protein